MTNFSWTEALDLDWYALKFIIKINISMTGTLKKNSRAAAPPPWEIKRNVQKRPSVSKDAPTTPSEPTPVIEIDPMPTPVTPASAAATNLPSIEVEEIALPPELCELMQQAPLSESARAAEESARAAEAAKKKEEESQKQRLENTPRRMEVGVVPKVSPKLSITKQQVVASPHEVRV